jgi:dipeptidase D
MVPQAESGVTHDFTRDPIRPRIDAGNPSWLTASGTTLGADNGIGVAMALSILDDDSLEHGPLECLFTVDEEDGMTGAREIAADLVSGTMLLNLDGEDDAEITIGCAGAIRTSAEIIHAPVKPPADLYWTKASVGGLQGGHSGVDIDKGRANAALLLVHLLAETREKLHLAWISGGTAANAIPREASAVIGIAPDRVQVFTETFIAETKAARIALGDRDPGLVAVLEPLAPPIAHPASALGPDGTGSLLAMLGALPNGLVAMEPEMPGLVRTSLNLGQLAGDIVDGAFRLDISVMVRSSSDEEKERLAATVERRIQGASDHGWRITQRRPAESPAWPPGTGSPLLATAKAAYRDLFGKDPKVASTHGGLETALFRPRFPAWDMLSIGPNIRYPHSPSERVEIASVARSYRFVRELVYRLRDAR